MSGLRWSGSLKTFRSSPLRVPIRPRNPYPESTAVDRYRDSHARGGSCHFSEAASKGSHRTTRTSAFVKEHFWERASRTTVRPSSISGQVGRRATADLGCANRQPGVAVSRNPSAEIAAVSPSDEFAVFLGCEEMYFLTCGGTLATVSLAGGSPRTLAEHVAQLTGIRMANGWSFRFWRRRARGWNFLRDMCSFSRRRVGLVILDFRLTEA